MIRAPDQVWLTSHAPCGAPHGASYRFQDPQEQLLAARPAQLPEVLRRVQAAAAGGLHAVGCVAYEAAGACDAALATQAPAGPLPPAWFGLYRRREAVAAQDAPSAGAFQLGAWQAALSAADHARAVDRIRAYIAAGDVYQVNHTFPLRAAFDGDCAGLYRALCRAQGGAAFCAYLDLGDAAVLSASPELFVAVGGDGTLRARPMKGTRPRGTSPGSDADLRDELAASAKERAENLMIVDLLRNDLGRVAQPGSVHVPALWQVEAYDTVWQMTSSIAAQVRADVGLVELFAALFPCGSVTGAPKVRATQIIRELEPEARGVYTGAVGWVSPAAGPGLRGTEAVFSVAIRTVTVDRAAGRATAGVGAGITWDSEAAAEYEECLTKARFLHVGAPPTGWPRR